MTDINWQRLYDLLINRLGEAGDPLAECEGFYLQAVAVGNVGVGAASVVVAAEILSAAARAGLDLTLADLSDERFAASVGNRLLHERSTVTSQEAATIIGCTDRHVRRLAQRGHIDGRRVAAGEWRCTAQSVLRYRKRRA